SALRAKAQQVEARDLGTRLLGPLAERLSRAERLLIPPDGPLHLVPFAALADPSSPARFRYLVESKPIGVAASATVFAELRKRRRASGPQRLVAFGDPDYSAAGAAGLVSPAAPVGLREARERGLDLGPLPATRQEVEGLERLYAGAVQ